VDRGAVSNVPDALGLADNAVGFHFYGKTKDLKFQYAIGLYDNRFIPANRQDLPMVVGRMEVNLGSTKDVYQDAHFGEDRWYSFGVNGSYHSSLENAAGVDDSTHAAAGVDGMVDLPFGKRRLLVRGEMNAIRTEWIGVNQENNTTVKMIEAGVLFRQVFQPFIPLRPGARQQLGGRRPAGHHVRGRELLPARPQPEDPGRRAHAVRHDGRGGRREAAVTDRLLERHRKTPALCARAPDQPGVRERLAEVSRARR
jgi:hypothetical protein